MDKIQILETFEKELRRTEDKVRDLKHQDEQVYNKRLSGYKSIFENFDILFRGIDLIGHELGYRKVFGKTGEDQRGNIQTGTYWAEVKDAE